MDQDTQEAIQDLKQELLTLRDEIRVQIHLGAMELKEKWPKIEAKLTNMEQHTSQFKEELLRDLREFRDVLFRDNKQA